MQSLSFPLLIINSKSTLMIKLLINFGFIFFLPFLCDHPHWNPPAASFSVPHWAWKSRQVIVTHAGTMNFLIYCIKSSFNFTPILFSTSDGKMERKQCTDFVVASLAMQEVCQLAAVRREPSHKSLDPLHSAHHLRPSALRSDREEEVENSSE